jgi:hypothetical protein
MIRSKPEASEELSFSATMRPGHVRLPRKIDFYRLPRPVQDRFAAATRRSAPPAPLLFCPAPSKSVWAYLVASGALALGATVLLLAGWGNIDSPFALHGKRLLAVDVALFAASAYGVVHAMGILRALDALPWRAGTYLFPACVVNADGPALLVWPVSEAEAVERVATPVSGLALRMGDGSRVVVPARADAAERAEAALRTIRQELARAIAEDDAHALAELDPLHDRAMSSPVGPTESMRPQVPVSKRFDWAIALAVGALLGLAIGTTRNSMSDEAMYRSTVATSSVAGYQRYLAQGGKHADEVRDVLLPRLELRDAEAQGTIEALQAFIAAHPTAKIGPEVDAALRRAMLLELDKAKKAGTVAALDDFAQKYPDDGTSPAPDGAALPTPPGHGQELVSAELKAARHALYVAALAAWRKKAQPDAATDAFMGRLLAWAERTKGPSCEVRFRFKPSQSLDDADKSVMKSGHFPGPDALPSKYVTSDAMRQREQRVAQSLVEGFASAFPADVLLARAGDRIAPDAPMPGSPPMLVIEYTPEWSRANTTSLRQNTVFAGLAFVFDTSFGLPEGAPLKVSVKSWRGAELWKIKSEGLSREDYQQKVYDAMFDGAFDQLGKKLTEMLF